MHYNYNTFTGVHAFSNSLQLFTETTGINHNLDGISISDNNFKTSKRNYVIDIEPSFFGIILQTISCNFDLQGNRLTMDWIDWIGAVNFRENQ